MPQHLNPHLISWASILDPQTEEQAHRASKMPFIHHHLALMPDAHLGKGATVGSVIPTLGAIMPAAVGVDIGCGMIAIRTQFHFDELPTGLGLASLRAAIERVIPLSAGRANASIYDSRTRRALEGLEWLARDLGGLDLGRPINPDQYLTGWRMQLGTLGSGNHFIEVSLDEEDRVWLVLHSGSRGVGNKLAQHHIKVAEEYCRKNYITLPHRDLAYLVEGTEEFSSYITELRWAQVYARTNREEMMRRVTDAFEAWIGEPVRPELEVNCHHNYTEQERHFGKQVWLSRKGAINAASGVWGFIPGSMGARSYIVTGKGNHLAYNSAPHGAGRVHSRSSAKRTFDMASLEERMVGVEWRHTEAFLDEHPDAYKDIDVVMRDAADLVEVQHELRQILNVKGD